MKKVLMVCIIIATVLGCSKDDDNGSNTPSLDNVTGTVEVQELYINDNTPVEITGNGKIIIE